MNAAFLLVTSACLAGQVADVKAGAAPAAPAPIVASSCGPNCGYDACGCGESFGHKLRDKLHGLFRKDCQDSCQPTTCHSTCGHKHHVRTESCDTGCKTKHWSWKPKGHDNCSTGCDSCSQGHSGGGFLSRLRGLFHKKDDCCHGGTSCGTGCVGNACAPSSGAPVITSPAVGEKIKESPKKMPDVPKKMPPVTKEPVKEPAKVPAKEPAKQDINFENPPSAIPPIANAPTAIPNVPAVAPAPLVPTVPTVPAVAAPPSVPTAPNIETTPNPAPRIEGDRRDPF